MAPPPSMGPMGMADLGPMAPLDTPEGVQLWGNPTLDAPPVPVDQMFPEETRPAAPLGLPDMGMGMGMGMAGQPSASPDMIRQMAMQALAQKAKQRLGASQGFQSAAMKMAAQRY
jgi:hypothetical protein